MKTIILLLLLGLLCFGGAWAAYQAVSPVAPAAPPLSRYVPSGALLYLHSSDFSSLLGEWNASPQKRAWLESSNYAVFSRSRLFLRLQEASQQFSAAAGLSPDVNFLGEMAGSQSAVALYDIGKLQFLYITRRASAGSMQSGLWQTRAKFETRGAGGVTFYLRRDAQSAREVAFAVNGDYLLLATREDLIAGALQLMQGRQNRTIEMEPWWSDAVADAGPEGDLRMVLNLEKIVPSPYFRSYWIQQNISDLRQYSTAVSDLFPARREYREERVLVKKPASGETPPPADSTAVSDLVRLVPSEGGVYEVQANPSADASYELLETKILFPHPGPPAAGQLAPQIQLTAREAGNGADMETRIDELPVPTTPLNDSAAPLKELLEKAQVRAILQVQVAEEDRDGVFVRMHSGIVLLGASDWNEAEVRAALINAVAPGLTAGGLGVNWQARVGYQELDGLWPLALAVQARYLLISDDATLLSSMLANINRAIVSQPAVFMAGFNHARERPTLEHLAAVLDRPNSGLGYFSDRGRAPQFFADNIASLSSTLAGISAEKIVVHDAGDKVTQTVTYTWGQ
jgi:hypothetical protein